jgi:hypothetical protein
MQDNRPDRPDVITLPPLILAATIALGVMLNFFWPASLLPSALAAPLGILITLGASPSEFRRCGRWLRRIRP